MKFVCLKLKSGDTLFAELLSHNYDDTVILHPFQIRTIANQMQSGSIESVILTPWMPFTDDNEFCIPNDTVMYIGRLSSSYLRFYGSSRFKEELSDLQRRGFDRVESGELKSDVVRDLFVEVRRMSQEYSEKYGLDPESMRDNVSFSGDEAEERVLH
jgi:hypothetical protein